MQLLERIEEQMSSTRLPLVAVTVAAVPYANTPIVLTLHWHGLSPTRLADARKRKGEALYFPSDNRFASSR